MTANDIRTQYGDMLSGEQVRQILHISKRKCTWILEHGYIPCSDTGGKTRRFAIRAEDLAAYMDDSAKHPERYTTPYAEFSSAKGRAKTGPDKPAYPTFPRELPEDFRMWLEDEWCGGADGICGDYGGQPHPCGEAEGGAHAGRAADSEGLAGGVHVRTWVCDTSEKPAAL